MLLEHLKRIHTAIVGPEPGLFYFASGIAVAIMVMIFLQV